MPKAPYELLDFLEDLALYEGNGYIKIDDLATLHSFKIICWWYAVEQVVVPYRQKRKDPAVWRGTEELVAELHTACAKDAPAWGQKPTAALMRILFEDELLMTMATKRSAVGITQR
jgi:hypothetical protein